MHICPDHLRDALGRDIPLQHDTITQPGPACEVCQAETRAMQLCPDHLYARIGRDRVQPGDQYTVTARGPECDACEAAHEADANATRRAA